VTPPHLPRLFIAAVPPDEVLDAIDRLDRPVEPGVRYTTRPQWHVTLRFLGRAPLDEAVAALASVQGEAAEAALGPAVARLGRGVLVIPVGGLDALAAAAVAAATAEVGVPPEPRPFAGHLTVARLKNRPACRVAGQRFSARFSVDRIHLIASHLDAAGARYECRASQALASGTRPPTSTDTP
jgi:2'-5' RNA ligase